MADIEVCGYCDGSGTVPGRCYDEEGRYRPEWPKRIRCEYCYGSGEVKDGGKLLPAKSWDCPEEKQE